MLLIPPLLLLILALGLTIRHRLRPSLGVSWLVAVLGVLLVWILMLVFRWLPLPLVVMGNWLVPQTATASGTAIQLEFQLDDAGWIYGFSLVSVLLAVLMTAAARQLVQNTYLNWLRSIILAALGLFAIFAANPLALILSWTAIDLVELALLLTALSNHRLNQRAVVAFAARVGGTLLLLWAAIASRVVDPLTGQGQVLMLANVDPRVSVFVLLAAGLRLGVLPLHLPFPEELPVRRGWGTTLRMVSMSTSLVVLARLPANAVPPEMAPYLLLFAALAALYGAVMWLSADEILGRPYWLISLAGMAVGCVIRGYPQASLAWGAALILPGAMIFLYSARTPALLYVMFLGLLSLSGMPFTPTASGWAGLVIPPFNLPDILYILAYALVLIGYLRHIFHPGQPLADMDRWMQTIYPFGLILLVIAIWLVAIFGWSGSLSLGNWWASLVTVILAGAGWFFMQRRQARTGEESGPAWWRSTLILRGAMWLAGFFSLNWAYRFLWWLYRGLQHLVQLLRLLLEGDGGVLWTLVLLALLVILLQVGSAG
jgi:hypothetical protein